MTDETLTNSQPSTPALPGVRGGRWAGTGGFAVAALTLFLFIAQSGVPSPLYPVYEHQLHLTPVEVTAIFSIYIAGLLASLLTVGSLSDHVGRRPVIVAAALSSVLALLLFASAHSLGQLLAARTLQGVSVGGGMGAVGAAMIDLQPPRWTRAAAVLNGALPPAGLAVGALTSGLLVQDLPAPTVTVYVLFTILIFTAAVLTLFLAERHAPRPVTPATLMPRAAMPPPARRVFTAVVGCMISSWALAGLYLGLGPTTVAGVLHEDNHLAAGVSIAIVTGVGALTGILTHRSDALRTMLIGALALVVGPLLTALALDDGSTWGFFASGVVAGVGFGAAFQGGLRLLLAVAPLDGRAALLSTVYLVSYSAFGLPAIVAGLLLPTLGLLTVIDAYAAFVVVVALAALALQLLMHRLRRAEEEADRLESPEPSEC
jgi:MFS family permease